MKTRTKTKTIIEAIQNEMNLKDIAAILEAVQEMVQDEMVDMEEEIETAPTETADDRDTVVAMKSDLRKLEKVDELIERAGLILEKL